MSNGNKPVTRVLSVRCNDVDIALCAQFLERLGTPLSTTSDIIKNVLALVASQAERTGIQPMPLQHAREFLAERYGSAGINRNKHTYAEHAFAQNRMRFNVDAVYEKPKRNGQELSGEAIIQYTTWLSDNNLTHEQCSFDDYLARMEQERKNEISQTVAAYSQMYEAPQAQELLDNTRNEEVPAGCDPSLPIAVGDAPEVLAERAAEREHEADEQKRLMEEFLQQQSENAK